MKKMLITYILLLSTTAFSQQSVSGISSLDGAALFNATGSMTLRIQGLPAEQMFNTLQSDHASEYYDSSLKRTVLLTKNIKNGTTCYKLTNDNKETSTYSCLKVLVK